MFDGVTLCGLVGRYQHFTGTYCLHLQPWRWKYCVVTEDFVPPKRDLWHLWMEQWRQFGVSDYL